MVMACIIMYPDIFCSVAARWLDMYGRWSSYLCTALRQVHNCRAAGFVLHAKVLACTQCSQKLGLVQELITAKYDETIEKTDQRVAFVILCPPIQ